MNSKNPRLMFLLHVLILFLLIPAPLWIGMALWHPVRHQHALLLPIAGSMFLAVFLPIIIIAIRHSIRLSRIRLIELFDENFLSKGSKGETGESKKAGYITSFEFVKGKYYVDIEQKPENMNISNLPRFPFSITSDWLLLLCSLPFMTFAGFGTFILLTPESMIKAQLYDWLKPNIFIIGGIFNYNGMTDYIIQTYINGITVGSVALAGAYFFCLRLFLRGIAAFDLSPITFLRAFLHLILAVFLATMIWRVVPSDAIGDGLANSVNAAESLVCRSSDSPVRSAAATAPCFESANSTTSETLKPLPRELNRLWLFTAFILGFVPEVALQYVFQRSPLSFKRRNSKVENHTPTIPITIVDGIDFYIAARLEEANIFDIENLAAFNPIMLHIETPYGIYQAIDWVAQAQLCCVVGPNKFLLLKSYNIRTIFDLERAVLDQAPAGVKWLIGSILFAEDKARKAIIEDFEMKPFPLEGGRDPDDQPKRPPFTQSLPDWLSLADIEHMVGVMIDDLHVHRLREIWERISEAIGRDTERLRRPFGNPNVPPA